MPWLKRPRWIALPAAGVACLAMAVSQLLGQAPGSGNGNAPVWQLDLKKFPPAGYQLQFTKPAKDSAGQPVLEADSRGNASSWHSCLVLPKGLLKAGEEYVAVLDYEIVDYSGEGSYFYLFARSDSLGYGADQWRKWGGDAGTRGTAKLHIAPTAGDFQITAGIYKQGAMRIRNLRILHGNGWSAVPLTASSGSEPPPTPPTGAQPFSVDPPANPNGPVVNPADFGAVADGDAPPATGPDRNLAAFKAAIAKCRETGASKLTLPKGVYRLTSGEGITFEGLNDFVFDGGGSTLLFHQTSGGAGMQIKKCNRAVFRNFNMDWDWTIDPLASVGRVTALARDSSYFETRFEGPAPLDPKRWVTMNPLDEKLLAPGAGKELGGFTPTRIESLDPQTVRVWLPHPVAPVVGQLYLLRHHIYDKHCILMNGNAHLSLQEVTIFSFPGIGFLVTGDQHHFELLHCRISYPKNQRRCITTTSDGFHVDQSQGFIKLEDCDFGYTGDDTVNIHVNIHMGVRQVDGHTLVAMGIVDWRCPFSAGDPVEIRNGDYSPTGFTGKLKSANWDSKANQTTLVFEQELPKRVAPDSMLFNHRFSSGNFIVRNCYFHENRARGILANTSDGLIEGNRFFHNQFAALHLIAEVNSSWAEGFGAQNIVVRDNEFRTVNPSGATDAAAVYVSADVNGSPARYPLLKDLLLEGNTFLELPGPAITAASFENLVIRGNHIVDLGPAAATMRGGIRAELGSGLWVDGNDWVTQKDSASPALFYDPDTASKIVRGSNRATVGAGKPAPAPARP